MRRSDSNLSLRNHANDIWACHFLSMTDLFLRQAFIIFIIELESRIVVHFGVTRAPIGEWVAQQPREATPFGAGSK